MKTENKRANRGEHPEGIKAPLPQGWPIPTDNDERVVFKVKRGHPYVNVLTAWVQIRGWLKPMRAAMGGGYGDGYSGATLLTYWFCR